MVNAQEDRLVRPLRPKYYDNEESPWRSRLLRQTRRNITRACDHCREKRIKCDGLRSCSACVRHGNLCKYNDIDRRRTRDSKATIDYLERRNTQLESIIYNHIPQIHGGQNTLSSSSRLRPEGGMECAVSQSTPQSTSNLSFGATNHTTENFDRNMASRATGFMGKNTDAGCIQALYDATQPKRTQATGSTSPGEPNADSNNKRLPGVKDILEGATTTSMSYSLDDIAITSPIVVDPQWKPPHRSAEFLAHQYFQTTQRYFPIIDETTFLREVRSAYNATSDPAPLGSKSPIIINLVFAISARYCETAQVNSVARSGSHLEYFTRARMCGLSESSIFDHSDLQQVQIEGLTAFYFLISGQTNRAWKVSGISVRSAVGFGLNLRTACSAVSDVSIEFRTRVWWSIWTLGQTLDRMTGRNSEVDLSICNVQLPRPFVEGGFDSCYSGQRFENAINDRTDISSDARISPYTISSLNRDDVFLSAELDDKDNASPATYNFPRVNDSHLYFHYLQLFLISQDVTKNLYMLDSSRRRWRDIEYSISVLLDLTVRWLDQLPRKYSFSCSMPVEGDALSLGCFFHSARIMITRPCLCRHDRRRMASSRIASFHRDTAEACLNSAKAIIALFPDDFDVARLSGASTWFQFTHHLVQAIIVLLIELKFWTGLKAVSSDELIRHVEKALHSLWLLSKADISASRAWNLCRGLFRRIDEEPHADVADFLGMGLQSDSSCSGLSSSPRVPFPSPGFSMSSGSATRADDIVPRTFLCTPFDELLVDSILF